MPLQEFDENVLRLEITVHDALFVGGLERVYEMGRVFRNEGLSPKYNPEFTMMECYQAYADYHDIMTLTEEIVVAGANAAGRPLVSSYQGRPIDLRPPYRRARMVDLVRDATGRAVTRIPVRPEHLIA